MEGVAPIHAGFGVEPLKRSDMRTRLAILALTLINFSFAPVRKPALLTEQGYYVVAYISEVDPDGARIVKRYLGPFDGTTAMSTMLSSGKDGWLDGGEFYPVHNVQKVWIYYRCSGCTIE